MYEQYLIRLLAPLGLYDLRAPHNGGELAALGGELDSVSGLVELVERESLLATAESEGLDRVDMKLADNQIELLQAVEQFIGAVVVRFAFIVSVDDRLGIFLHLVGDRSEFVL